MFHANIFDILNDLRPFKKQAILPFFLTRSKIFVSVFLKKKRHQNFISFLTFEDERRLLSFFLT